MERGKDMKILKQGALIILLSLIVGVGFNLLFDTGVSPFSPFGDPQSHLNDPRRISTSDLITAIENRSAIIIDTRDKEDFASGHIPGALNAPYFYMEIAYNDVVDKISLSDRLVFYGYNIADIAPVRSMDYYHYLNFQNLKIYLDGYEKWQSEGLPVEKGAENGE
jgi:rhodanese-related sulfurtransferase